MLESTCYYDDDPETRESFFKIEDSPALKRRNLWINGSKTVHFVSEVHADIFKCFRLLPPNVGRYELRHTYIYIYILNDTI